MRKLFAVIMGFQVVLGLVMVALGFMRLISDDFFVNYYLLLYRPALDLLARGSGFMGLFFVLPVIMAIYSLVLAGIFTILRNWAESKSFE